MGPYMVTYWCVSECCSLIGSYRLYVYRNAKTALTLSVRWQAMSPSEVGVGASDQADHFLSVIIFTVWRTI